MQEYDILVNYPSLDKYFHPYYEIKRKEYGYASGDPLIYQAVYPPTLYSSFTTASWNDYNDYNYQGSGSSVDYNSNYDGSGEPDYGSGSGSGSMSVTTSMSSGGGGATNVLTTQSNCCDF